MNKCDDYSILNCYTYDGKSRSAQALDLLSAPFRIAMGGRSITSSPDESLVSPYSTCKRVQMIALSILAIIIFPVGMIMGSALAIKALSMESHVMQLQEKLHELENANLFQKAHSSFNELSVSKLDEISIEFTANQNSVQLDETETVVPESVEEANQPYQSETVKEIKKNEAVEEEYFKFEIVPLHQEKKTWFLSVRKDAKIEDIKRTVFYKNLITSPDMRLVDARLIYKGRYLDPNNNLMEYLKIPEKCIKVYAILRFTSAESIIRPKLIQKKLEQGPVHHISILYNPILSNIPATELRVEHSPTNNHPIIMNPANGPYKSENVEEIAQDQIVANDCFKIEIKTPFNQNKSLGFFSVHKDAKISEIEDAVLHKVRLNGVKLIFAGKQLEQEYALNKYLSDSQQTSIFYVMQRRRGDGN
jgi:hypothetical protein